MCIATAQHAAHVGKNLHLRLHNLLSAASHVWLHAWCGRATTEEFMAAMPPVYEKVCFHVLLPGLSLHPAMPL